MPIVRTAGGTTSIGHQQPPKPAKTLASRIESPMIISSFPMSEPINTLRAAVAKAKTAMTSSDNGTSPRFKRKKILPTTKSINAWSIPISHRARSLAW